MCNSSSQTSDDFIWKLKETPTFPRPISESFFDLSFMSYSGFVKAGILTVVLVTSAISCYEWYWRSQGYTISYNDDKQLWAYRRKFVYEPKSQSTVFIGSSRIKFDLDLPTWEKVTGDHSVMLAMVGTSPRLLLKNLADDDSFKGKLILDVTEPLFYSRNTHRTDKSAEEGIEFYKKGTPSQRASAYIGFGMESIFVFLQEEAFSLNTLLNEIPLPARKGVFQFPNFPKQFEEVTFQRQSFMTPMFVADTSLQKWQADNWTKLGALDTTPAIKGDTLQMIFEELKTAIDKIKSRGGEVMFVRTPSSGGYLKTENKVFPKNEYWDRMLAYTNTPGIHFTDDPAIDHFTCPEWSHLTPKDAVTYTENLIRILEEKGWTFPEKSAAP